MARDISARNIGPCQLLLATVDMGFTKGDVSFSPSRDGVPITVDQQGSNELNNYHIGDAVTAQVPIAQNNLAAWQAIFPQGTLLGGNRIGIGKSPGSSELASAKQLILRPEENAEAADNSLDITIHKAYVSEYGEFTLNYSEDARVWVLTFTGLHDLTRTNGNRLWAIGPTP